MDLDLKIGDFVSLDVAMLTKITGVNIYTKTSEIYLRRIYLTPAVLKSFENKICIVTNLRPDFYTKMRTNRPKHLREIFDPTENVYYVLRESCLVLVMQTER